MSTNIIGVLLSSFGIILSLVVLAATIILYIRTKSNVVVLMIIGQIVTLIMNLYFVVGLPLLMKVSESYDSIHNLSYIGQIIGIIGGLLFSIGFIIYAINFTKNAGLKY